MWLNVRNCVNALRPQAPGGTVGGCPLEWNVSTCTCTGVTSRSWQTISHWSEFLVQRRLFPRLQLCAVSVGPLYCQPSTTASDFFRQSKMQWLTRCHDCPCPPCLSKRMLSLEWKNDWLTHYLLRTSHATRVDPVLSRVLEFVRQGSLQHVEDLRLQPFFNRRFELSVEQDCLLWGLRVIIPTRYQEDMLEELHTGHPGIVRMKELARSYLRWPNIDQEIEQA